MSNFICIDKAIYLGLTAKYTMSIDSFKNTITDFNRVREGVDTLVSIERVGFQDGHVAIDIDGVAGQAYRFYEVVLGRSPDLKGLGYWINDIANGIYYTPWIS